MIQHRGTQPITTPRLFLRQFTLSDAKPMFSGWAGNPKVTRYVTWNFHHSVQETKGLLEQWVKAYQTASFYEWAIVEAASGRLIGSIGAAVQEDSSSCEIGYCVAPDFWNQGYATEACRAVIAYLFDCGIQSIDALHDVRNPASGRVMQKCGMQYRGDKSAYLPAKQETVSCRYYEILKEGDKHL